MPETTADISWTSWHGHPSVIAGLLILAVGYLLGVWPLRRRFGWASEVGSGQVTLFLTGTLLIFVALLSPLHELGDNYLFSAHMVQHLILTLVVPPLLLAGTPAWLLRPVLRFPHVFKVAKFLTKPVTAFILFNAVFVTWHMPVFYDLALRELEIHVLEHLMFLFAGLVLWWPILSPLPELPRAPYIVQVLYLFVQPTVPAILGAVITFSDHVLYEWYEAAPRVWSISALDDQQLGGLIMWVPGGLAFLVTLVVVFLMWAAKEESSSSPQGSES